VSRTDAYDWFWIGVWAIFAISLLVVGSLP
jgi:hypothetical protein